MISYQVSNTTLTSLKQATFDVAPILQQFVQSFKDEVDFVVFLTDSGADGPGTAPIFGRYSSTLHRFSGQSRLLGDLFFPYATTAITGGPFLHEFIHEFANMGTIPNEQDNGHWGYASTGGQIGGFDPASLTQPNPNSPEIYKAGVRRCTPLPNASAATLSSCNEWRTFGTFANGGNSVPYSQIELWTMGLIPDNQLTPIRVAIAPFSMDVVNGTFGVIGWDFHNAARIRSNLGSRAPNSTNPRTAYRAAVVVLTDKAALDTTTQTRLLNELKIMQARGTDPALLGCNGECQTQHNFYTATGGRATLNFTGLSSLKR